MSVVFKLKSNTSVGAIPSSGDLVAGELAINLADRRLFSKDDGGTVFTLTPGNGNSTVAGVVLVVDSVTNTSVTAAAAANAVKRAYDAAIAANTNASNASFLSSGTVAVARLPTGNATSAGILQVLDSVTNTSVLIAASANSVKRAYDAAIAANTNASNASFLSSGTVAVARLPTANTTASGIVELATAAEFRAGAAGVLAIPVEAAWDSLAEVTLSNTSTISWNMSTGINFGVTPTGTRTLGNPTNTTVGKRGHLIKYGSGALSFSSNFVFAGGTPPSQSTGTDVWDYEVLPNGKILMTLAASDVS